MTFAVAEGSSVAQILEDWTAKLAEAFSASKLFDLPVSQSIYRVFLLPGCLQLDLSFTPAQEFGAIGPQFKLLFGEAVQKPLPPPPQAEDLFGYAVHHLLRARFCIERGRLLQAEYWVSSGRHYALNLACLQHGLSPSHGRGFDQLPPDIRDQASGALVRSLDRASLLAALTATVAILRSQSSCIPDIAATVEPELQMLTASWII